MRTIVIRNPGKGVEAWALTDKPDPKPGAGQVLIRVRAASLNYRDLAMASGYYLADHKPDLIPLSDGAGEIVALGAGVNRWRMGDRVCAAYYPTWLGDELRDEDWARPLGANDLDGMLAEYAVLDETAIVRMPAHMSFAQASTLPCAALTAWNALFEGTTAIKPGATVVTQGTGGVSLFVAQMALAAGARVIATTSSPAKATRLRALGVDAVVDYRATPEWSKEVLRLTSGLGADHIVDVGGAGTLPQSFTAVRRGGVVSLVGLLTGKNDIDPLPVLFRNITLRGFSVGSVSMFQRMNKALEQTKLVPVIDETFPIERAADALRKLAAGSHIGKLVIEV